jgi:hypothetical protein
MHLRASPQHRSQLHARLEHLRLRRPFRDSEQPADLFVIEPFDVQHERLAAAFRQPRDRRSRSIRAIGVSRRAVS